MSRQFLRNIFVFVTALAARGDGASGANIFPF
jgi:hypothetical protein